MTQQPYDIFYRLDKNDRIIEVGGAWDAFAGDNDGEGAMACQVEGTLLWSHISSDEAAMFIESALHHARLSSVPIEVTYDCSSRKVKRDAQMRLTRAPEGGVLVEHRFLRITPFEILPILSAHEVRDAFVKVCIHCGRIRVDGAWVREDEAPLREDQRKYYGVCPCRKTADPQT